MFINWSPIRKLIWLKASGAIVPDLPWKTITGNPLSFIARTAHALKSCVVGIEPSQNLHGQANPYPAGGGKNMLAMTLANIKTINTAGTWNGDKYTYAGVDYTINTDEGGNISSILVNGTASAYSLLRLVNEPLYTVETILNGCPSGGSTSGYRLEATRLDSSGETKQDVGYGITLPANATYSRIIIAVPQGTNVSSKTFYPMVRLSSVSDATFAPYSNICPISGFTGANVYVESAYDPSADPKVSVSWQSSAGTVYGGTLDVTTGVLTVDRVGITESSSTGWTGDSGGQRAYKAFTGIKPITAATQKIDAISNYLVAITTQQGTQQHLQGMYFGANNSENVSIHIDGVTDKNTAANILSALNTYFSDNPLQVVYKLATPQTYQLTAQQVSAIVGENNMWTDCATLTVEAKAMD